MDLLIHRHRHDEKNDHHDGTMRSNDFILSLNRTMLIWLVIPILLLFMRWITTADAYFVLYFPLTPFHLYSDTSLELASLPSLHLHLILDSIS